eukprot:SAG31_NODE_238_length_19470_cov_8.921532_11_plen_2902_part_00
MTIVHNVTISVDDNDFLGIRFSPNATLHVAENGRDSMTVNLTRHKSVANVSAARNFCASAGSELAVLANAADFDEARSLCTDAGCYTGLVAHSAVSEQSSDLQNVDNSNVNFVLAWGDVVLENVSATEFPIVPPVSVRPRATLVSTLRHTDRGLMRWDDGSSLLHPLCSVPIEHDAAYSVSLKSQPTDAVVLEIEPVGDIFVSPPYLVFSAHNWSQPTKVVVKAIDDLIAGPLKTARVFHRIETADPMYASLGIQTMDVVIVDNDVVAIELSATHVTITESPGMFQGALYTVRLSAVPIAEVTVELFITSSDTEPDIMLSRQELIFSADRWDEEQIVVVSSVNDLYDEGDTELVTIVHRIRGDSQARNSWNLTVTITDDDTAPVPMYYDTVTSVIAGPISGGTLLTVSPVFEQPDVMHLFHFLLSRDSRVQCRFSTQSSSAVVVVDGQADLSFAIPRLTCRSPAVQSELSVAWQRSELATVQFSVAGVSWVQASFFFTFFAPFSVSVPSPLSGDDSGGVVVKFTVETEYSATFATCLFGHEVVTATLTDQFLSCTAPPVTLTDSSVKVMLSMSLNGQQYVESNFNFTYYSSSLSTGSVVPTSGPFTGGTIVHVDVGELQLLPGVWMCKFDSTTGIVTTVHAADPTAGRIKCISPASPLPTVYSISVTLNGQQYIDTGELFSTYPVPLVSAIDTTSIPLDFAGSIRLTGSITASDAAIVRLIPPGGNESIYARTRSLQNEISFALPQEVTGRIFERGDALHKGADLQVAVSLNEYDFHLSDTSISLYNPRVPPSITSLRPASGAKEGGSKISLSGTNFAGVNFLSCRFGPLSSPAVFISSREATCVAPANVLPGSSSSTPGVANVAITNGDFGYGEMTSSDQVSFRYTETSPADSIASGPGVGGTTEAGTLGMFSIDAKTESLVARETGGDFFYVELQDMYQVAQFGIVADLDPQFYDENIFDDTNYNSAQALVEDMLPLGGTYSALYMVTVAGTYSMSVTAGGIHVRDSPFTQRIVPSDLDPWSSNFWTNETVMVAAQGVNFLAYLQLTDRFGNHRMETLENGLEVVARIVLCRRSTTNSSVDGCDSSVSAPEVLSPRDFRPGLLEFEHQFTVSGLYRFECLVNGESIRDTDRELMFTIMPAPTAAVDTVSLPGTMTAGISQSFRFDSFDKFGNSREVGGDDHRLALVHVTASMLGSNQSVAAITTVNDLRNSSYAAVTLATVAGTYAVTVTTQAGVLISETGLQIVVHPAELHLPTCLISGAGMMSATAGNESTFDVHGNDRFGNLRLVSDGVYSVTWQHELKRVERFSAQGISHSEANEMLFYSKDWIYQNEPAMHRVAYNTTVAGAYIMNISFSGIMFRQHQVMVYPAQVDPFTSIAFGSGLAGSVAGQLASFYLTLRDQYGNDRLHTSDLSQLAVEHTSLDPVPPFWQDGPGYFIQSWQSTIERLPNGTYHCLYLFLPWMRFQLHIRYGNAALGPGSVNISNEPAATPVVTHAKFDDSLVRIVLTFDQDTNTGGMGYDSRCEIIFDPDIIALLGDGATCRWRSPSVLVVFLGYGSTITTTSAAQLEGPSVYGSWNYMLNIRPRANVLALYENSRPCNSSVAIMPPTSSPKPVARIDASLRVGICDPLFISGERSYGGGPRTLKYTWEAGENGDHFMLSYGSTISAYLDQINSLTSEYWAGQPFLSLGSADTVPGMRYGFRLTVRNFIGLNSTDSVIVEKVNVSIPSVSILAGDRRQILRSDHLLIQGTASLPNADCLPPDASVMDYTWTQESGPRFNMLAKTSKNKDLYLRPHTLEAYYTYRLKLSVKPCSRNRWTLSLTCIDAATNYAYVWITVDPEPLVAKIAGGNRIVGTDSVLTLDANVSFDPSQVSAPFVYAWTCWMTYPEEYIWKAGETEGPCITNQITHRSYTQSLLNFTNDISNSAHSVVQYIMPFTLFSAPFPGLRYDFSVQVSKASNISGIVDLRTASTNVTIYMVPGEPPQVAVQLAVPRVNADTRLILLGNIDSHIPFHRPSWYVMQGHLDLDNPQTTSTSRYGQINMPEANLVINSGVLVPGQEYKFRLQVVDTDDSVGFGEIHFTVNEPPSCGKFGVRPSMGVALNTSFGLFMDGWADDISDLPLVYRFAYSVGSTDENNIGNFAESSSETAIFPTGANSTDNASNPHDYPVVVIGYVADRYGAATRQQFTISVHPPNVTATEMTALASGTIDSLCSTYEELGYIDKANACLGATISLVNNLPNSTTSTRTASESSEALRDSFVDKMVSFGGDATPTAVNIRTGLAMAASATSAATELSKNATAKSLGFIDGIVSSANVLDAGTGSTTTTALSNVASAWLAPEEEVQIDRRRLTIDNDTASVACIANCSYPHGICILGECLCHEYHCFEGRCKRVGYPRVQGQCYLPEDECTNTTCYEYICESGLCSPNDSLCTEGMCSTSTSGTTTCFRGACEVAPVYYAKPNCELPPPDKAAAERQDRRDDKCTANTIHEAVDKLSSAILAERVIGEESVDYDTAMIKSTSVRGNANSFAEQNFSTPGPHGTVTTFSMPDSLLGIVPGTGTNQSNRRRLEFADGPVDVQATMWGDNIHKHSETSAGMTGTVTSICIGGCVSSTVISDGFVFSMPTDFLSVGGGACANHADCGCLKPPTLSISAAEDCTGICINSTCQCRAPYTGEHCTVQAQCKFWDVETETYTTGTGKRPDCVVVDVHTDSITCNCTHLTDFASFQDEWIPSMNFINPFDAELFSAIFADPRNIVIVVVIVSMYAMWIWGCIEGYRRDSMDRHNFYMQEVSRQFGKSSLTNSTHIPVAVHQTLNLDDQEKEAAKKKAQQKVEQIERAKKRMEKLNLRKTQAAKLKSAQRKTFGSCLTFHFIIVVHFALFAAQTNYKRTPWQWISKYKERA